MISLNAFLSMPLTEAPSFFGFPLVVRVTGYGLLIIACGLASFGTYIARLFTRESLPPISAWILWLTIDVVAMGTEIGRGIFNVQIVTYTVGSVIVCFILLKKPTVSWDPLWDTLTTLVTSLAIATWLLSGSATWGLWLSLLAMWIASFPLLRGLYTYKIEDEPADSWLFFLLGSACAYLDGLVITGMVLSVMQVIIITLIIRGKVRS